MYFIKRALSCAGLILLSFNIKAAEVASFYGFTYTGKDAVFEAPLAKGEYQNPILAGFYPDPSITRAGDDYYLVNSSFSYSPGVPIFHSKDLIHWESLGHILLTPKQLPLYKQQVSRGIYAPTLRYHEGVFYLITTQVDVRGNFIVTATNPAGPWSDPIELPEVGGIDPDIFFDDDGHVYIIHNDNPIGEPLYQGHRAIWQWEYDLKTQKIIKGSGHVIVNGGSDINKKPVWIEGPHIYKINGWYYLMCAEGGTSVDHSEVIFRTRSLKEPFTAYEGNPILTQRDLNPKRTAPITTTGHADLVQTKEGEWWSVFLGTRSYDEKYFNTGRETFLLPVTWKNEWPVILNKGAEVPYRLPIPRTTHITVATPTTGNFVWRDNFTTHQLRPEWNTLGTVEAPWYRLQKNHLDLIPSNNRLSDLAQPSFIGRRQQHMRFDANTKLQLPKSEHISAGIAIFQNEKANYYFAVKKMATQYQLFVEQTNKAAPTITASTTLSTHEIPEKIVLGMTGDAGKITFYYQNRAGKRINILQDMDAKMLSTEVAGGFVGTYIGMHTRIEP